MRTRATANQASVRTCYVVAKVHAHNAHKDRIFARLYKTAVSQEGDCGAISRSASKRAVILSASSWHFYLAVCIEKSRYMYTPHMLLHRNKHVT